MQTLCVLDAEQQIFSVEGLAQNANSKTEEYAQLLSGSVSTVPALEGETSLLQQTIVMHREEITQLNREIKESRNHMTTTNSTLRAPLNLAESTFTSEQRDVSTRLQEDLRLRNQLLTRLSRETVWKQELQAARDHTLSEIQIYPE